MQDGRTRKLERMEAPPAGGFFAGNEAVLVLKNGPTSGSEFRVPGSGAVIGRGDAAALHFDDHAMSKEHAIFEASESGLRIRDLGSTNGVRLNGADTLSADLAHGDEIEIGTHCFQLVIEQSRAAPRVYEIDDALDDEREDELDDPEA